MPKVKSNHSNNLKEQDLLAIKALLIDPLKETLHEAIGAAIAPLVLRVENVEESETKTIERVSSLEGSQRKALLGWGVIATGFAGLISWGWTWIKSKLHWT